MFIKLNKNTVYINFNKHKLNYVICNIKDLITKREYIAMSITPIGHTFTFKTQQPYLSLYWQKDITGEIFNKENTKREV